MIGGTALTGCRAVFCRHAGTARVATISDRELIQKDQYPVVSDASIGNPHLYVEIGEARVHAGSYGLKVHSGPSLATGCRYIGFDADNGYLATPDRDN